jgi:hypothetical protein
MIEIMDTLMIIRDLQDNFFRLGAESQGRESGHRVRGKTQGKDSGERLRGKRQGKDSGERLRGKTQRREIFKGIAYFF